jgi:hypothetical protein
MPPAEELHLVIDLRQQREYVERSIDVGSVDLIGVRAAVGEFKLSAEISAEPLAD